MAYIGRTPTNAALTAADRADGIVITAKIAADAVTDAKIADDVVGTEHLTANEVDTAALGADAVTGAQLADNAVNSEHYTDGSIDTAHIADAQITAAKLASGVGVGRFANQLLHVRDEKSAGTQGGSSSANTDNVRVINTVVTNEITGASLGSNRITLPSGTYYIDAEAHAFKSDINRLILYNHSDSSIVILGTAIYADFNYSSVGHSFLTGRFTISASKNFEIRHRTGRAISTNGFGVSAGDSRTEVYFDTKIWKVA